MKRAAGLAAAAALALLAASISCATFDYPGGSCRGAPVVSGASDAQKGTCASCVEQRCCDTIGRCEDEGARCTDPVHAMQACVVDGGPKPSVEARCGPALGSSDGGRATYTCMRDSCGAECGLPSCHVDPAALLIVDSTCDECFTDSCCAELNACYQNRSCKLTTECIVQRCGADLGAALRAGGATGFGQLDVDDAGLCTNNDPPPTQLAQGPLACIFGCIGEFGARDPSAALDPHRGAYCLSTKIFQCALRSGCAESCANPQAKPPADAGPDAP